MEPSRNAGAFTTDADYRIQSPYSRQGQWNTTRSPRNGYNGFDKSHAYDTSSVNLPRNTPSVSPFRLPTALGSKTERPDIAAANSSTATATASLYAYSPPLQQPSHVWPPPAFPPPAYGDAGASAFLTSPSSPYTNVAAALNSRHRIRKGSYSNGTNNGTNNGIGSGSVNGNSHSHSHSSGNGIGNGSYLNNKYSAMEESNSAGMAYYGSDSVYQNTAPATITTAMEPPVGQHKRLKPRVFSQDSVDEVLSMSTSQSDLSMDSSGRDWSPPPPPPPASVLAGHMNPAAAAAAATSHQSGDDAANGNGGSKGNGLSTGPRSGRRAGYGSHQFPNHHNHHQHRPRDEFDGPHQLLERPPPEWYKMMQERELPHLPTHLPVQEQDSVLRKVNDRLSQCAFDFVARYQFPIPVMQEMRPVERPQDREWTEWVQLLKRLATKRRIPARVLYQNGIRQLVTVLENSLEMRHAARPQSSRPLKDDRNILQLISAGIQVAKILKDPLAMDFLDKLYIATDMKIKERAAEAHFLRG